MDYQDKFSSGINDFIDAIHDTYERILPFPFIHPMVQELADETIRGIHVQANRKRSNYANDFPFKLIYKVYREKREIVIYQLWPEKSDRRIEGLE